jgi:hypothetical protein
MSQDRESDETESGRGVKTAVDASHGIARFLTFLAPHLVGPDDRGEDADAADEQRKDDPLIWLVSRPGPPQDQSGDGHFVALEDVGGHTGAVAYVVAYQVGDHGGVARIVFGQTRFDLTDQVGAHVSGLV